MGDKFSTKLLLVDDEKDYLDSLGRLFRKNGYSVDEAEAAAEALEMFKEGQYDILLVDRRLGTEDGLELTREILEIDKDAKVIINTGWADRDSCIKALEIGACRYLYKGNSEDTLAVIKSLTDLKELEDEIKKGIDNSHWLKQVVKELGCGIAIIDRSYRILYANDEQLRISNKAAKVGGICWAEFDQTFEQKEPCPWCAVKKVFETGKSEETITLSPVEGEIRYFRSKATPIFSRDNRVVAAAEAVIDVTESQQLISMTLEERLEKILRHIKSLGYDRVRLYLLSPDGQFLVGCFQVGGGLKKDIRELKLPVNEDSCTKAIFSSNGPLFFPKDHPGRVEELDDVLGRNNLETGTMEVALRVKGSPIGKIVLDNLYSKKPLEENQFLMKYVNHTAKVVDEFRAREAMQKRSEQLEKLRDLESKISLEVDLDKRLQIIINSCLEFLGAPMGHIRILENGELRLASGKGGYYDIADKSLAKNSNPLTGSVVAWNTNQPLIVNDSSKYENWEDLKQGIKDENKGSELEKIKSFVTFPLKTPHGEFVGTLSIQSDKLGFFTKEICLMAEDFARMASVTICEAKRAEIERRRVRDLKSLSELSGYLQTIRDVERLMNAALSGLVLEGTGGIKRAVLLNRKGEKLELHSCIWPTNKEESVSFLSLYQGNNIQERVGKFIDSQDQDKYIASVGHISLAICSLNKNKETMEIMNPFVIEANTNNDELRKLLPRLKSEYIIAIPLVSGDHIIGLILADDMMGNPKAIGQDKLELLYIYGSHTAITIENAEADTKLREFLFTVSHELKSPIAGLEMFLDIIKSQLKNENDALILTRELERYRGFVYNLVEHARIESDIVRINKEDFNLKDMVMDVEKLLKSSLEIKGKKLVSTIPDDLSIYSDKSMLKCILINLIDNAIKYSQEKTSINISSEVPDESVKVTVNNDGKGISKEQIALMLRQENFLGHNKALEGEGLGIGFEIVKKFVHVLGGQVGIESQPGNTNVWFTIPKQV